MMGELGTRKVMHTGRSGSSVLPVSLPGSWGEVTLHKGNWYLYWKLAEGNQALFLLPGAPHCSQGVWAPHAVNEGVPFPFPAREINLDWIFSCEGCPPPLRHYHNEMEVAR